MDRQQISSSMMTSIGYDPANGTLEIEFKSDGSVWDYFDFPEYMWNEFLISESQGKYWHLNIKNKFRESRVG